MNTNPTKSTPHTPDTDLQDSDPLPRNVNSPDLGGSFEENGQRRGHDGIGAGPGMEVLDEALAAAAETERHSSSGS